MEEQACYVKCRQKQDCHQSQTHENIRETRLFKFKNNNSHNLNYRCQKSIFLLLNKNNTERKWMFLHASMS